MKYILAVLLAISSLVMATDYQSLLSNDLTVSDAAPASNTKGLVVRMVGTVTTSGGTGASATEVQGTAANGAAVAGNPVRIGGSDGGTTRDITVDNDGELIVHQKAMATSLSDGRSNASNIAQTEDETNIIIVPTFGHFYNGTTWDRVRGDTTNGMTVDLGSNNDVSLNAGTNNIGDVDVKSMASAATIDTAFTAQTADFTIEAATANLRLMGWSIKEDAGTAAVATVTLRHDADGTCDSTAVIAFIELDANQSAQMNYGDRGLAVPSGVCADVTAGSVSFAAQFVTEANP